MNDVKQLKFSIARDHILAWIRKGHLPFDGRLPSERELARQLSIDQRTVRRGLKELVAAGLVIKRPRVGNFVRQSTPSEMVTQIAVILPDWMLHNAPLHPIPLLIHKGINRALNRDDYSVSTYWYGSDRLWEDAGRHIVARGVRGALIYPQNTRAAAAIQEIMNAGVEVACLEHNPPLDDIEVFSVDTGTNTTGHRFYKVLLEGMVKRGHRDVATAIYVPSTETDQIRRDLKQLASEYGLGNPNQMLFEVQSDGYRWDREALGQILDRKPRPTAVVVADEFLAADLLRACYQRGINIPDDLSIAAAFSHTPHLHPVPLTSPDWAKLRAHASELAAQHLVKAIRGERPLLQRLVLRPEIQWTQSVKACSGVESSQMRDRLRSNLQTRS